MSQINIKLLLECGTAMLEPLGFTLTTTDTALSISPTTERRRAFDIELQSMENPTRSFIHYNL
jgi:hypothetical protein